jgi:uncharacterized protein YbjT (DUF2867 family)
VVKAELHDLTGLHQDSQGPQMFLLFRTRRDAKSYALFRYHSVFKAEQFKDVPHFASKLAIESALREFDLPFTIIRPNYF